MNDSYQLYNVDSKALPHTDDDSIDLIVTDPPYNSMYEYLGYGSTQRIKRSDQPDDGWFPVIRDDEFPYVLQQWFRVLKPGHHLYLFLDTFTMLRIAPMMERMDENPAYRFKIKNLIVWDKCRIGMGYNYRRQHELILFMIKPSKSVRKLNSRGTPDILTVPNIPSKKRLHPTEKPVELLDILIGNSTAPGDVVLDPFFGSASCGVSALKHNCQFEGYELDPNHFNRGRLRLEEGVV